MASQMSLTNFLKKTPPPSSTATTKQVPQSEGNVDRTSDADKNSSENQPRSQSVTPKSSKRKQPAQKRARATKLTPKNDSSEKNATVDEIDDDEIVLLDEDGNDAAEKSTLNKMKTGENPVKIETDKKNDDENQQQPAENENDIICEDDEQTTSSTNSELKGDSVVVNVSECGSPTPTTNADGENVETIESANSSAAEPEARLVANALTPVTNVSRKRKPSNNNASTPTPSTPTGSATSLTPTGSAKRMKPDSAMKHKRELERQQKLEQKEREKAEKEAERQRLKEQKEKERQEKEAEKERLRLEKEKEKENQRIEKERLKQEALEKKEREKAEKERLRLEKEEEQKRQKQEKEAEKERLRLEKEAEKEKARSEKEAERLKIQQQKDEEKRRKDEERLAAESEKQRQEAEKTAKAERQKAFFKNFFSKADPVARQSLGEAMPNCRFQPFEIKDGMVLAPQHRRTIDDAEKQALDDAIRAQCDPRSLLYLARLQQPTPSDSEQQHSYLPRKSERTPLPVKEDDDEDEIELLEQTKTGGHRMRAKLFQFHENYRPAYYGTFRGTSELVNARRPFAKDEKFTNYDVDSDEEWEEEPDDADECLSDDDKEEECENEPDNGDDDDGFFVEHGYLSEGEGEQEDGENDNIDETERRERLEAKARAWKSEKLDKNWVRLHPIVIGPIWQGEDKDPALIEKLMTYRVWCVRPVLTSFNMPKAPSPPPVKQPTTTPQQQPDNTPQQQQQQHVNNDAPNNDNDATKIVHNQNQTTATTPKIGVQKENVADSDGVSVITTPKTGGGSVSKKAPKSKDSSSGGTPKSSIKNKHSIEKSVVVKKPTVTLDKLFAKSS